MGTDWQPTYSEAFLEQTKFFENRDSIESLAAAADNMNTAADSLALLRLMNGSHPSFASTDACYAGQCQYCRNANGALIEHAARWFRRYPNASFVNLMRDSHVFAAAREGFEAIRKSVLAGQVDAPMYDKSTVEHTLVACAIAGEHYAHGMRVYEVRENLLERLKHTATRGLEIEDLKLPYPTVWFQFPREVVRFRNARGTLFDLTGIFMREFKRKDSRWLDLAFFGRKTFDEDDKEDLVATICTPLTIDWIQKIQTVDHLDLSGKVLRELAGNTSFESFLESIWALLVNVIMYATWPLEGTVEETEYNPEVKKLRDQAKKHPPGHKKQRALDKLRRVMPKHRYVLGANVPADVPPGHPLDTRSLVQGHWQRYAVGPGKPNERTARRWVYRAPFWRGPQDAPEANKRHQLG